MRCMRCYAMIVRHFEYCDRGYLLSTVFVVSVRDRVHNMRTHGNANVCLFLFTFIAIFSFFPLNLPKPIAPSIRKCYPSKKKKENPF